MAIIKKDKTIFYKLFFFFLKKYNDVRINVKVILTLECFVSISCLKLISC